MSSFQYHEREKRHGQPEDTADEQIPANTSRTDITHLPEAVLDQIFAYVAKDEPTPLIRSRTLLGDSADLSGAKESEIAKVFAADRDKINAFYLSQKDWAIEIDIASGAKGIRDLTAGLYSHPYLNEYLFRQHRRPGARICHLTLKIIPDSPGIQSSDCESGVLYTIDIARPGGNVTVKMRHERLSISKLAWPPRKEVKRSIFAFFDARGLLDRPGTRLGMNLAEIGTLLRYMWRAALSYKQTYTLDQLVQMLSAQTTYRLLRWSQPGEMHTGMTGYDTDDEEYQ